VTEPLADDRLAEIRAARAAASPGPWAWSGDTSNNRLYLSCWIPGWGRTTVMDFVRWGMASAQPRFRDGNMMSKAAEHAVWEVAREATHRDDQRLYRHDVVGVRNADARFIAAAPGYVDDLLAEVDRLRLWHCVVDGRTSPCGECSGCRYTHNLPADAPIVDGLARWLR
jgi:hypothetical protein